MPEQSPAHTDRRRAGSFGAAADDYDRHRPRYPRPLVAGLITRRGVDVLDVGAGTGIASAQFAAAGANVLAVEPDPRMVRVAAAKGIRVEQATFEDWRQAGREFDLVVFAQSFHWVDPRIALQKVTSILRQGGRLVLLWNRIAPTSPTQRDLDEVIAEYVDVMARARARANAEDEVTALIEEFGFSVERRQCTEQMHYTTEDYLDMISTYSNQLLLAPATQAELRSRLARKIGTAGVDVNNDALAVVCTPTVAQRFSISDQG